MSECGATTIHRLRDFHARNSAIIHHRLDLGKTAPHERHHTSRERLAPVMSAEIIDPWKLNDSADVTTIDFNGSFTIPATSSSRFKTVCPVRQLGTGRAFRQKTSSLSTSIRCLRVRCSKRWSNSEHETPSSSPCCAWLSFCCYVSEDIGATRRRGARWRGVSRCARVARQPHSSTRRQISTRRQG